MSNEHTSKHRRSQCRSSADEISLARKQCVLAFINIISKRLDITLRGANYDVSPPYFKYEVKDTTELSAWLDDLSFDALWMQINGRDCDFFFQDYSLPKLKRLWCSLILYDEDGLEIDRALALDHRDVIHRRMPSLRRSTLQLVKARISSVTDRSKLIYKVGKLVRQYGATKNEVACVLAETTAFQSKHGDNRIALEREVERICR